MSVPIGSNQWLSISSIGNLTLELVKPVRSDKLAIQKKLPPCIELTRIDLVPLRRIRNTGARSKGLVENYDLLLQGSGTLRRHAGYDLHTLARTSSTACRRITHFHFDLVRRCAPPHSS